MKNSSWSIIAPLFVFLCWFFLGEWFYIGPWLIAVTILIIIFIIAFAILILSIIFEDSFDKKVRPVLNKI